MNIIGKSECTASQMAQYLINKNPNAKSWALEYAQLYLEEGEIEGVRGDGAWIQSCKETGNFMFTGGTAVTFDQNNFCGLGVTKKGVKGHSFDTPRLGIRAQIQHLKAYATTAPLKNPCIDPRYKYVSKGCAPRFEDLVGKWAVPGYNTNLASSLEDAMNKKIGYGFDIIAGINNMKAIKENNEEVSPLGNITSSTYLNETIHGMKVNTSIKCSSTNYQTTSNRKIEYIVIHYTGNAKKDTAVNNAKYFQGTNRKASAHFFVDDTSIYQSVDLKDSAWHCGASNYRHAKCRNLNSIGIEMCCTAGNYMVSSKTQENTAYLCARLCRLIGVSASEVDTYVLTHNSVTGKACPRQYVNNPSEFTAFKKMVKEILKNGGVSYAPINNNMTSSATSSFIHNGIDYSLVFNPTFYSNRYGDLKKAFGTDSKKLFSHFVEYGMKEGRVAHEKFNVQAYKRRYLDLQNAFGNNLPKYYEHYIRYGKRENRTAI